MNIAQQLCEAGFYHLPFREGEAEADSAAVGSDTANSGCQVILG